MTEKNFVRRVPHHVDDALRESPWQIDSLMTIVWLLVMCVILSGAANVILAFKWGEAQTAVESLFQAQRRIP